MVRPSSPIKNWDKSVKGFLSYDRTYKQSKEITTLYVYINRYLTLITELGLERNSITSWRSGSRHWTPGTLFIPDQSKDEYLEARQSRWPNLLVGICLHMLILKKLVFQNYLIFWKKILTAKSWRIKSLCNKIKVSSDPSFYMSDSQCVSEPPRGRVSAELSKPVKRKGAMCVVLV